MAGFDFTGKGLEKMVRLAVPQLIFLVLILLSLVALPIPAAGLVKPYMVLMAIYYWAIYRPTLVPPVLCFAAGLIMDILTGMPLGLTAMVFVLVRWIVSSQRRFLRGQPYIAIWAFFGLVAVLAGLLQWGLLGLVHMHWSPPGPVGLTVLVSLFFFPFITLLLIGAHRLLPVASRAIP
jgi:rod shape-determining protein MreD